MVDNQQKVEANLPMLLSRTECAELLRISKTTLWRWTKSKKIKSYGLQGRVYYKSDEVINALVALKN